MSTSKNSFNQASFGQNYASLISAPDAGAPAYEPEKWQPFKEITNCYDYAANDPDYVGQASDPTQLIPERLLQTRMFRGDENEFQKFVADIQNGLIADGAIPINAENFEGWAGNGGGYMIAAFAKRSYDATTDRDDNAMDYHFMRKNADGTWSQKWGELEPTNLDKSGHVINDPLEADMGDYQFIGYYGVAHNGMDVGEGPRYPSGMAPETRINLDQQVYKASGQEWKLSGP